VKAVFIKRGCLLPAGFPEGAGVGEVRLAVGVPEGLRSLAERDLFVVMLDSTPCGAEDGAPPPGDGEVTQRILELVLANEGQVDALLQCPHDPEHRCGCWGTHPGFLYAAAAELDLRPNECYLLCDDPGDVALAYQVGCRPMLMLGGRSIGSLYGGHQPESPGFPVASDFGSAVRYVLHEDETTEEWGHGRQVLPVSPVEDAAPPGETLEFSPVLTLFSPVPGKPLLRPSLKPLSPQARQWLLLFVAGGVVLSLGIAYLLTHLYRVQPFPEFVWYLTLQFIPRPLRGLLFIAGGGVIVAVSLRAFWHLFPGNNRRR